MRTTLTRTVTIALVAGTIVSRWLGWSRWPLAVLLMLWPSFGGHWVELWFLNWLRPRIPAARGAQVAARVATWFAGGRALTTAAADPRALADIARAPDLWRP
jgi:hypothetical protein